MTRQKQGPLQGPWYGVRDSLDPQVGDPRLLRDLQNMIPRFPSLGGPVVSRGGFTMAQDSQLGAGTDRRTQCIYHWTKLNGTQYTVVFCGGKMYTYNHGTSTFTEVTLVGVSLSAGVTIYCTDFADQLIVNPNDGTNKPFAWDGTTFTSLTNASTAYGRPTVYYAKLFFIKWAERSTLIWSEEGLVNTGYEAGGYNNAWTLRQTDQNPLYAIEATNEALFYWRARSVGSIEGPVLENFTSTGVHDSISTTVGSMSPGAIVLRNDKIFFPDADGRPHYLQIGRPGVRPIWYDCAVTISELNKGDLEVAVGVNYTPTDQILFAVPDPLANWPTFVLTFQDDPDIGIHYTGTWRGFELNCAAMVLNADGTPTLMHGAEGTNETYSGYFYLHSDPRYGDVWSDGLKAGTAGVEHIVETCPIGPTPRWPVQYDEADIMLKQLTDLTNATIQIAGPNDSTTINIPTLQGGGARWDEAVWDVDVWPQAGGEKKFTVGLRGLDRWVTLKVRHDQSGEQLGVHQILPQAFVDQPDPNAP